MAEGVTVTGEGIITVDGVNYAPVGTVINFAAKTGYILNKGSIESVMVPDTYNVFYLVKVATATSTEVWGGLKGADGSAKNPYLISDAEGLKALANFVNAGNNCKGLNFKLTANIDMKDVKDFAPIGRLDSTNNIHYSFNGTFDGDNKTISNLTISADDKKAVGLFGYVSEATIKNVTLNNANVTLTNTADPTQVGALVGYNYGGNITNNTIIASNVQGADNVGGLVGYNYSGGKVIGNKVIATVTGSSEGDIGTVVGENNNGSVTGNFYRSDVDAVGNNQSTAENNSLLCKLTLPEGVTAQGTTVTIGDTTYYGGNVTLKIGTGAALGKVTGVDNVAANSNGQVTFNIASDTAITADNIFYAVTVNGATISGNSITVDKQAYYRGEVTATAKTGYLVESPVTVNTATNITATLDDKNHYVLANDTKTLATVANTTAYPDLVQVYELTLPDNVTVEGSIVITDNGKTYAAGNVTIEPAEGYTLDNIKVNGTASGDTFTVNGDTNITADVTAIAAEDIFNAAGTAVVVMGKRGDFSANSQLYSITASQQNSTLIANAKANQIIVAGGNENILTGGAGNDTFKFSAGGGIVTDYGIGATKSGNGKALATASGTDIVKVDGKVKGIYFDRDASTKKSATFTATIVYGDDQVVVLKDIAKKPTKTNSNPSKAIYQTNDVAAATLKIWDTSNTKQAVISATNLKKLFHDDSDDAFTEILQAKTDYLVNLSEDKPNATNPFGTQLTFTGGKKD